jgi:ABC-type branched-subunit amino acid transport system ATPase component
MNPDAVLRPIIEARKVDKRFGAFHALRDVSATFYEGQVTAIVGPFRIGKIDLSAHPESPRNA